MLSEELQSRVAEVEHHSDLRMSISIDDDNLHLHDHVISCPEQDLFFVGGDLNGHVEEKAVDPVITVKKGRGIGTVLVVYREERRELAGVLSCEKGSEKNRRFRAL